VLFWQRRLLPLSLVACVAAGRLLAAMGWGVVVSAGHSRKHWGAANLRERPRPLEKG